MRLASRLVLALDPDTAGDQATLRGLEAARQSLEREWEPVIATGLVQEGGLEAQLRIVACRTSSARWLAVVDRCAMGIAYQAGSHRRLLPGHRSGPRRRI